MPNEKREPMPERFAIVLGESAKYEQLIARLDAHQYEALNEAQEELRSLIATDSFALTALVFRGMVQVLDAVQAVVDFQERGYCDEYGNLPEGMQTDRDRGRPVEGYEMPYDPFDDEGDDE